MCDKTAEIPCASRPNTRMDKKPERPDTAPPPPPPLSKCPEPEEFDATSILVELRDAENARMEAEKQAACDQAARAATTRLNEILGEARDALKAAERLCMSAMTWAFVVGVVAGGVCGALITGLVWAIMT